MNTSPDAQPPRRGWFSRVFGRKPVEQAPPSNVAHDPVSSAQPPLVEPTHAEPAAPVMASPVPAAHADTHAAEASAAAEVTAPAPEPTQPAAPEPEPAEPVLSTPEMADAPAHPAMAEAEPARDAPVDAPQQATPPAAHGLMTLSDFIAPSDEAPAPSESSVIAREHAEPDPAEHESGHAAPAPTETSAAADPAPLPEPLDADATVTEPAPAPQPASAADPAPEPGAARDMLPEEEEALQRIRRLINQGRNDEAASLCQSAFGDRLFVRDKQGHPVFFKEMLRIALRRGDEAAVQAIAERFRQVLKPRDPVVDIMCARHFTDAGAWEQAREAWQRALAIDPNRRAALDGLEEVKAKSAAQTV